MCTYCAPLIKNGPPQKPVFEAWWSVVHFFFALRLSVRESSAGGAT